MPTKPSTDWSAGLRPAPAPAAPPAAVVQPATVAWAMPSLMVDGRVMGIEPTKKMEISANIMSLTSKNHGFHQQKVEFDQPEWS